MVDISLCLTWWYKPRNVERPIRVLTKTPPISYQSSEPRDYISKLSSLMLGLQDNAVQLPNVKQVPIFYSGWPVDSEILLSTTIAFLIGGVFAGINCVAWSYTASSFMELFLWRVSSLAVLGLLLFGCTALLLHICFYDFLKQDYGYSRRMMGRLILFSGLLYMAARGASIVLAFKELKRLPSSTYDTIPWLQFIPHV